MKKSVHAFLVRGLLFVETSCEQQMDWGQDTEEDRQPLRFQGLK